MARFSLEISDELNEWLVECADEVNRSKNQQIEYLLNGIKEMSELQRRFRIAHLAFMRFIERWSDERD